MTIDITNHTSSPSEHSYCDTDNDDRISPTPQSIISHNNDNNNDNPVIQHDNNKQQYNKQQQYDTTMSNSQETISSSSTDDSKNSIDSNNNNHNYVDNNQLTNHTNNNNDIKDIKIDIKTQSNTHSGYEKSNNNNNNHSNNNNTKHDYKGSGTEDDPYIVTFETNDEITNQINPLGFTLRRKFIYTFVTAVSTLVVSFCSSCYSGSADSVMPAFDTNLETFTLGISLYVLGFGVGPLLWAPLSEMYGRRPIFYGTYSMFVLWLGACIGAPNMGSLLGFRFLAGIFGASTITNAGGTISDMFMPKQRGNAVSLYAFSVFCGPVLGPFIGGYSSMYAGWQWTFTVMCLFGAVMLIINTIIVPETYSPVLLKHRAQQLNKQSNNNIHYTTIVEKQNGKIKLVELYRTSLTRPFTLLLFEPIVNLLAIWIAIVYGTLYLAFEAYPSVFEIARGWNAGQTGLTFIAVGVGMAIGVLLNALYYNPKYIRECENSPNGKAQPEARLPMACAGSIITPCALFLFAWLSYADIHWSAPVIVMAPFGTGMVMTFMAVNSYLIDCYARYAASALAANTLLRSLFGFAFPLFANYMYADLGNQIASTIVAVLSVLCVPLPFIYYKYGHRIRRRSKRAINTSMDLDKPTQQRQRSNQSSNNRSSNKNNNDQDYNDNNCEQNNEFQDPNQPNASINYDTRDQDQNVVLTTLNRVISIDHDSHRHAHHFVT